MKTEDIIQELAQTGRISRETIQEVNDDTDLRIEMIHYFNQHQNRPFVLELLRTLSELRKDPDEDISGASLMLACYLLGKHQQVEDCMRVWEAKRIDFDTYCYVDGQLIPFAGIQETIAYLKTQTGEEAGRALQYLEGGDYDNLDTYYGEIPWFVNQ
ncbi:hypothetical protein [Chitinophaga agri]|uniref:Uncharacterized protein n=1 Tax=Chitinophaga agri TaxID=2703787 RepID=A0A6B9Z8Y5_9BACT|nr:hypothetical protein [Chitinophaga agri]QHS58339.1 hypothetical protein GWR21_01635 [Chitinophaga agri]